ncbi:MAG: valine--pyruvate transaminase [Caldilineaceae bacterium]|nr:valine--pyruvate transaminase [Caldilineaceae bacterium]
MQTSAFGEKFLDDCGILQLMADLGEAASRPGAIMLGGGNPAHIPDVQALFRRRMALVLDSENDFETLIGNYSAPAGDLAFIDAVVALCRRRFGWEIGPENVALTNGSQTAFFCLFNLFGGTTRDGRKRKILLPLAPEYIGYVDAGIEDDLFVSARSRIEFLADRLFKYHVDFDALEIGDEIGAICVSRPTNPTGNVLTEEEMATLGALARAHGIPFIVDNAYGTPFPGIIYTEATPAWDPNTVMCMSLSKLGLPGARTGIVIANEEIIRALTGMNAVMSLAPGSFGAYLALDLMRSGEIVLMSNTIIRPHYQRKAERALALLRQALAGTPAYIHKPEGAFFFWLWFKDLPISAQELYRRLKERNVIIVPGHYFFPGLAEEWPHRHECIRMSYAGAPDVVEAGIEIIAEEVRRAYAS